MAWMYGHAETVTLEHDYKRDHIVPDNEENKL